MFNKCKSIVNLILGTLLGVLALLMFSQVISRYIFNYSITWSEEFPRILLVWIVFFGLINLAKLFKRLSGTETLPVLGSIVQKG